MTAEMTSPPPLTTLSRCLGYDALVLENDTEWQALSEFVRSLTGSGSVDAVHFGEEPSLGSVQFLKMFLGSTSHFW